MLGGKRLWLIALALFLVGSVLASLAWSAGSLIATAGALTEAFQQSSWWAIGFTAVGVLVSLALPGRPGAPVDAAPAAGEAPVPAR